MGRRITKNHHVSTTLQWSCSLMQSSTHLVRQDAKNFNSVQRVQNSLARLVSIPASNQIPALVYTSHRTCQVQTRRCDVQSPTIPAVILPSPTHQPASTHSLSAFVKFYSTHRSTHRNNYHSSGFLHLCSNCLEEQFAIRSQRNVITTSIFAPTEKNIFFNVSLNQRVS